MGEGQKKYNDKEYKKEYYQRNKEKIKAASKINRERSLEKYKEVASKRYFTNRERLIRERAERRNNEDPVLLSEKRKAWYRNNPEPKLKAGKVWRDNNREYMNLKQREYAARNKDKRAEREARRRAIKKTCTPVWLTKEDNRIIKSFYVKAKELTKKTGIKHVVDHVIPLKGKTVSGLHVPNNLQILTDSENAKKHNSFIPFFKPLALSFNKTEL